jgi:3-oxoacyl-[acyl-carrier protein] reductase
LDSIDFMFILNGCGGVEIWTLELKEKLHWWLRQAGDWAGLTGFLKTIATELAPNGIAVNALLPGTHKTPRNNQIVEHRAGLEGRSENELYQEMMAAIPCKTIGDPLDFGAAAAFLAGVQARFITGQSLLVDGGSYKGLL